MNILFIGPTQREMGTILLYLKAGWNVTVKRLEGLQIGGVEFSRTQIDELKETFATNDEIQSQNNAS